LQPAPQAQEDTNETSRNPPQIALMCTQSRKVLAIYAVDAAEFASVDNMASRTLKLRPEKTGSDKCFSKMEATFSLQCSFLREAGPDSEVSSMASHVRPVGPAGRPTLGAIDEAEGAAGDGEQDLSGFDDEPEPGPSASSNPFAQPAEPEPAPPKSNGNPFAQPAPEPAQSNRNPFAKPEPAPEPAQSNRNPFAKPEPEPAPTKSNGNPFAKPPSSNPFAAPAAPAASAAALASGAAAVSTAEMDALRDEVERMRHELEAQQRESDEVEEDLCAILDQYLVDKRDVDEARWDAGGRLAPSTLTAWVSREMVRFTNSHADKVSGLEGELELAGEREMEKQQLLQAAEEEGIGVRQELSQAVGRVTDLERDLEEARAAQEEAETALQEVREGGDAATAAAILKLEQDLEEANANARRAVGEVQEELDEREAELERTVEENEAVREEQDAKIKELEADLAAAQERLVNLEAGHEDHVADKEGLEKATEDMRIQNAALEVSVAAAAAKAKVTEEELAELRAEQVELRAAQESLQEEKNNIEADFGRSQERWSTELAQLNEKIEFLDKCNEELKQQGEEQSDETGSDMDRMMREKQEAVEKAKDLEHEFEAASQEILQLREDLKAAEKVKEGLRESLRDAESEKTALQGDLEAASAATAAATAAAGASSATKLVELQDALVAAESERDALKESRDAARGQSRLDSTRIRELEQELERAKNSPPPAEVAAVAATASAAAVGGATSLEHAREVNDLKARIAEQNREQREMTAALRRMEIRLEESQNQINAGANGAAEVEQLRNKLTESEETLSLSRQQFEVVVENLTNQNEELSAKLAGTKIALTQVADENEQLREGGSPPPVTAHHGNAANNGGGRRGLKAPNLKAPNLKALNLKTPNLKNPFARKS